MYLNYLNNKCIDATDASMRKYNRLTADGTLIGEVTNEEDVFDETAGVSFTLDI